MRFDRLALIAASLTAAAALQGCGADNPAATAKASPSPTAESKAVGVFADSYFKAMSIDDGKLAAFTKDQTHCVAENVFGRLTKQELRSGLTNADGTYDKNLGDGTLLSPGRGISAKAARVYVQAHFECLGSGAAYFVATARYMRAAFDEMDAMLDKSSAPTPQLSDSDWVAATNCIAKLATDDQLLEHFVYGLTKGVAGAKLPDSISEPVSACEPKTS